jgi:hypothetical protein
MLLYTRGGCENWDDWSRSLGDDDDLGRRGIESLNHPKDCKVGKDDCDQGSNGDRKNLVEIHLSFATTEQTEMQTNPLRSEEDPRIDALLRVIKGTIDWNNLVPTLLEAAKELEAMPGLKGSEKLDLLQKALKSALRSSSLSAEEKEKSLYWIDTVVPVAVQALILASKSPVLAQVKAVCVGCWTK